MTASILKQDANTSKVQKNALLGQKHNLHILGSSSLSSYKTTLEQQLKWGKTMKNEMEI